MAVVTVAFEDLDTWLQAQPANTADTPYELNITGLTAKDILKSSTSGTLGYVLNNNNAKYVNLSYTILPNSVTNMYYCFQDCTSLTEAPVIPNGVRDLFCCFERCSSLTTAPAIPNSVTNMDECFYGCTSLITAPEIPNGVIYMTECFYGCTSLTTAPNLPNSVTAMHRCFERCTSLTTVPNLPNGITNISNCFNGCTSLTTAPNIPSSVTNMNSCFNACSSLTIAPVIPSGVTDLYSCFNACISLTTVSDIPNSVTDMRFCFNYCPSLTTWKQRNTPDNVNSYANAFNTCTNLINIYTDKQVSIKSFLNTLYTEEQFPTDPDNLNFYIYDYPEASGVPFSELDTFLQGLFENTTQTPYKINVTELIASDIGNSSTTGTLGNVLKNNNAKYVDLSNTVLPNSVTYMEHCFDGCTSLIIAPEIPNSVRYMGDCFKDCTSLTTAPVIPNSVTGMDNCFENCTSLTEAPVIPNSVTNMYYCFYGCTSLTEAPVISSSVRNMAACFDGCTSLTEAPVIPSSVWNMSVCFRGCTSLTEAPVIPNSVTDMRACFSGCTSLTEAPVIPNSVTDMEKCFKGCSSLEEITLFEADLESLIANNKAENCFSGCTSLTKIGVPSGATESPDWHVFRLKFDTNTIEGKTFDRTGTAATIPQTTITKKVLKLPIKTDEMWFPSNYSDTDIDNIIQKVIQFRYTYWNKDVLDPSKKNFVLWADDPDNVKTNVIPDINPLHIAKGGSIYADGTKANVPIIKMKDNTADAYGNGIVIGGGGATVIGGGESADTYYSGAGLLAGSETMVVANDGAINFVSNLQSGYSNGKTMTLDTSGNLSLPSTFTTSLKNDSSWWINTTPRGKFTGTNGGSSSGWSPLLAGKTVSGKYEFGSLNNTVYLNYYKDSRTANGIDKTIFDYTDGGTPNWNGNATSASNASKLNGYASSTSNTANNIVRRDDHGYIYGTYYNASCGVEALTNYSNIYLLFTGNGDGWFRKCDIPVQKSSIGGTTTETGSHWVYVTKAKFTTTGGYIVYSNGLTIQWGNKSANTYNISFWFSFSVVCTHFNFVANRSSATGDGWHYYHSLTKSGVRVMSHDETALWIAIGY